jgi:glycolate oxidase
LFSILPHLTVLREKEDLIPYAFDGTATLKAMLERVVFPTSAQEVSTIVKIADACEVPIVTRGSRTGLSGGSIPVKGGLVLCLSRMDRILEVDTKNLTLLAESA